MSDKSELSPLMAEPDAQRDLFICDIFDAVPKGDQASMEHPIFSISKKPDKTRREYSSPDGKYSLSVYPSDKGLATIFDRDILIYVISQAMAKINSGQPIGRRIRFHAHDLLQATGRGTGGASYERLRNAFFRLKGTVLETNITTGNIAQIKGFSIIDEYDIIKETYEGRMLELEVTLSDWIFNSIRFKQVLTLHRDYFRLRKPLARMMYQLARKHCGQQKSWAISLPNLQIKCGSKSTLHEFNRLVLDVIQENIKHDHFPDYTIEIEQRKGGLQRSIVRFKNRSAAKLSKPKEAAPELKEDTLQKAYEAAYEVSGMRIDKHAVHQEWVQFWRDSGQPKFDNNDAAFIGFAKAKSRSLR